MIKYLIILFLIIPISTYTNTDNTNKKYNILVLPINIKTTSKIKLNNINSTNKEELTKLLQSYLVFSGMKVSSYKYAIKTTKLIRKNNISYKDIPLHFRKLKKLDYILLSELNRVKQCYIVGTQLVNAKTGEIVFVAKHKVFNYNNKPLFNADSRNISIQNGSTLELINGISKKIVNFIRYKGKISNLKKYRDKESLLQIMFVVDNSPTIQSKLIYIKNNLKQFVENIHNKHKNTKIEIAIIAGENTQPFTDNIITIESHINKLIKNPKIDYENFKEKLYTGLINKDWSIYDTDHRLIFLITDDPIKRQISFDEEHKILIFPPIFYDMNENNKQNTHNKDNINKARNIIYRELVNSVESPEIIGQKQVNQIINNVNNVELKTYYNQWEKITAQLRAIHNINYVVDGTLKKEDDNYKLSIYIRDIKKNKTVHTTHIYAENLFGIIKDIDYVRYRVTNFYTRLLSTEENKLIENIRKTDFSKIIGIARAKSINVYTIGYDNINVEVKNILQRMAELMGGEYIDIKYNISRSLNDNQKVSFLYGNQTPYKDKGNNLLISKDINKNKDKTVLIKQGYNVNKNTKPPFELKGIFELIGKKIESLDKAKPQGENFILQSDGYLYPFTIIGLKKKEINKLNNIISQNKEVILASPIIPSLAYRIDYQENNKLVKKLIKFTLSPYKTRIYITKKDNNISSLLEKPIENINKNPYLFSKMGLIEKQKLWLIRGSLRKATK